MYLPQINTNISNEHGFFKHRGLSEIQKGYDRIGIGGKSTMPQKKSIKRKRY